VKGSVESFFLLGSTINSQGTSSQEIRHRRALGRAARKALGKILRCCDVSIPTKLRILQAMVFPVTLHGSKSWTLKKQERKRIDVLVLEKIPEWTMDSQENKPMGHQANQPRALTQGTNDQAQIVPVQTLWGRL